MRRSRHVSSSADGAGAARDAAPGAGHPSPGPGRHRGGGSWYEDRAAGLGARFLARVGDALRSAHESPERYRLIYRDVRRVSVPDFPYAVYFVIRDDRVHVVACMHGRRHPSRWQGRARNL